MNLAIAGLRHGHIMALYKQAKETEGISVIGAWEQDVSAREAAEKTVTEPFYESLEALLADPAVDAVAVGDYYGARGQIIIRALKAGKHVIADKPLCTSLEELECIRALSAEKKLRVACMLDLRYDAAICTAREIIRSGRLGAIHAAAFTGQHPLNWGVRPMWYFEEGKHGGTINDLAIHGIDAIRYMTGLELVRPVAARTWNAFAKEAPDFRDCAQLMAEFEGGMGVMADVSYAVVSRDPGALPMYWRFTLWGEMGMIELRLGEQELLFAGPGMAEMEKIPCRPVEENWLTDFMKTYDQAAVEDVLTSQRATLTLQRAADEEQKGK